MNPKQEENGSISYFQYMEEYENHHGYLYADSNWKTDCFMVLPDVLNNIEMK